MRMQSPDLSDPDEVTILESTPSGNLRSSFSGIKHLRARQSWLGLLVYGNVVLVLAIYNLIMVMVGEREKKGWLTAVVALISSLSVWCPLIVRSSHGPSLSRSAQAVAVLVVAFVIQILVHLTCDAEIEEENVELASSIVAMVQLVGLVFSNIDLVMAQFPLPLAFGLTLSVAQFVAVLLAQEVEGESQRADKFWRACGCAVALLAAAECLQLLWRCLHDALELSGQEQCAQAEVIKELHRAKSSLEERLEEVGCSPKETPQAYSMRSNFDDLVAECESSMQTLRKDTRVPPDVVKSMKRMADKMQSALLSPDLFKANATSLLPTGWSRTGSRCHSDPLKRRTSTLTHLAGLREMCSDDPIKVLSVIPVDEADDELEGRLIRSVSNDTSNFDHSSGPVVCTTRSSGRSVTMPDIALPKETRLPGSIGTIGTESDSQSECDSIQQVETFNDVSKLLSQASCWGKSRHSGSKINFVISKVPDPDSNFGEWTFNVLEYQQKCQGHALLGMGMKFGIELLRELVEVPRSAELEAFLVEIESRYRPLQYHNSSHAADVLNSVMYFIAQSDEAARLKDYMTPISKVARLAGFMAAVVHDVGHFGKNNRYHIMQHHAIAALYNDSSPLENMHCAIGFLVLRKRRCAFLQNPPKDDNKVSNPGSSPRGRKKGRKGTDSSLRKKFVSNDSCGSVNEQSAHGAFERMTSPGTGILSDEEFTQLRRAVIDAVLATDMAKHVEVASRFRAAIGEKEGMSHADAHAPIFQESQADRDIKVIGMAVKVADLGHGAKLAAITTEWSKRIYCEFFAQGDEERSMGLPISPMCERLEFGIGKAQVGFLDFLVLPTYKLWQFYLPTAGIQKDCIDQIKRNVEFWKTDGATILAEDTGPADTRTETNSTIN